MNHWNKSRWIIRKWFDFYSVIDSGIGMNQQILSKLSEPFENINNNTMNNNGTGIGLYTS